MGENAGDFIHELKELFPKTKEDLEKIDLKIFKFCHIMNYSITLIIQIWKDI